MRNVSVLKKIVAPLAAVALVATSVLTATAATAAPQIISSADFEDGTLGGWEQSAGGAGTLSVIDFDGGKVLQVASRDQDYVGVQTVAGALASLTPGETLHETCGTGFVSVSVTVRRFALTGNSLRTTTNASAKERTVSRRRARLGIAAVIAAGALVSLPSSPPSPTRSSSRRSTSRTAPPAPGPRAEAAPARCYVVDPDDAGSKVLQRQRPQRRLRRHRRAHRASSSRARRTPSR